jgi:NitT/TauT family transport system ATP-binding protein
MDTEKPAIIELKNVSKWFPGRGIGERVLAVQNIHLVIRDDEMGEFLAILGPSGSGKSTILNMIAGLLEPSEGEVLTFGRPVKGPNPQVVTVPQSYTCFPWLTAQGNVEFGLAIQNKPARERSQLSSVYLERVGLGDRLRAYPKELSGGMQQRVAIARALAMKMPVLIMDEPFGALDAPTRAEMQQLLLQLWSEEKNTIIFITHDITEALLLADRILVLSPHPGQIIQDIRVPFARPRLAELTLEPDFLNLNQAILHLLRQSPQSGSVRVTV